ncbi:MAG TPA: Gfo/Idh/MocA family oxidoreductase [Marmoricola sp.]|nr:Gfo/Idh/MocA family oxidoreductase [Marmoricola sp.]
MLRIGVIGLGAIGREHLGIYRALPGVQVTAVADFQKDLANSLAVSDEKAFGSATELLASGLVDAVSLCTPDHLHYRDAIEVIDSGTHLLLEKPISTSVDEADDLVERSEASDLVVMPGHTLRFMDRYIAARALFASGELGGLIHGYARRNNKVSVAERVAGRTTPTFFLGIHDIDAIAWITGERIVEVQGMTTTQRTPDGLQPVATQATLRMSNGAIFQLEAAWGLPNAFPTDIDARLRIVGADGELSIDIHDHGMRAFSDRLTYPVPAAFDVYEVPTGALYNELNAFARSVERHTPPPISMREAADAVRVATAIDRAIVSGNIEKV